MSPVALVQKIPSFGSIQVRREISESAWSESAQSFARDCIRACVHDHEVCGSGESLLPTRVIEVGNIGDETLRLYETQRGIVGQYAALSYCWGSEQPLKTTSANIKDMVSGVLGLSQLPQTIADAVHVTRSLGVQYLWVDALCIIQDSIEDWERESEQMSTIYEKAYVVIAASSSSSVTQGFLTYQRQQRPHYFNISASYGIQPTVAARANPQTGFHSPDKKTDPLAQRAWAFQEQHMSTRCLIFSADELQWVCKKKAVCECGITGGPAHAYYHPLLLAYCADTQQDDDARDRLELQDIWRKAVSEYSCRKLTRPDDKLPAFSGLASRFGARMGFRYVAGLWEENIIQDLAWTRVSWLEPTLSPLPVDYRAPSFSWASINDRVCYFFADYHRTWQWISYSSVSDVRSVVPGHNPFGRVVDAWITIRGPIIRGAIDWADDQPRFCSQYGGISEYLDEDCELTEFSCVIQGNDDERSVRRCEPSRLSEESARGDPEGNDKPPHAVKSSQENDTIQPKLAGPSVWLLHLGGWAPDPTDAQAEGAEAGYNYYLVLGRSPRDPEKYERIGSCNIMGDLQPFDTHRERFALTTITIL